MTQQNIQDGFVVVKVDAPANGQPLTVTANMQTAAGKSVEQATDTATRHTEEPNPVTAIEIGDKNAYLKGSEIVGDNVSTVIKLPNTIKEGDTVTITTDKGFNNVVRVNAANVKAKALATNISATGLQEGEQLQVTAVVNNGFGNQSTPKRQLLQRHHATNKRCDKCFC